MNPLVIYILKAGLCLAVLFLVYHILLSRDTMYVRNRLFIMISLLSAFILPLISIHTRTPNDLQVFGREFSDVMVTGISESSPDVSSTLASLTWQQWLMIVYLAGVSFAGIKFIAEILSLVFLIVSQKKEDGNIIRIANSRSSGFSAFGYIFIDKSLNPDEAEEIIRHEQKHLDRYHFFDILTAELLKVIQWFNPFIYMFDKSLREVHEFQADEECLNSGIPVHSYQGLVMNQVFRARIFNVSNSFSNPTLIKKRMIMMTKKRSGEIANLKMLLALPVVAVLLIVFSTCTEKIAYNDVVVEGVVPTANAPDIPKGVTEPYVVVEEMPMYPGGDSVLLSFIGMNTIYPDSAKKAGVQGRVIVRFCITETGSVDKISVLKGVSPELDKEAVRVVSMLDKFEPGKQGGKAVPVWYMVPITFALSPGKSETLAPPPPPPAPPAGGEVTEPAFAPKVVLEEKIPTPPDGFTLVEEMPKYPGGDAAMLKFIGENTQYPDSAKAHGVTGRVIVRFLVTETGSVDRITVLKGVDSDLDREAMRVCSLLGDFTPGKQGGKEVPVWYMVPITFTLK